MKLIIILFFSLHFMNGFSQQDRNKILSNFDFIEYYPDSTIKAAHKFTGVTLERFTVEFNPNGMPMAMGKYQKGKKVGEWLYANGSVDRFPESLSMWDLDPKAVPFGYHSNDAPGKTSGSLHAGCGTGVRLAMEEFQKAYCELLHSKTTN